MAESSSVSLSARGLDLYYGDFHALKHVDIDVAKCRLTSLIGPSGCGKSTLLRVFNRMNDLVPGCRVSGQVEVAGEAIYQPGVDTCALRKRVGMVFQRPNPFPFSVFDNIAYGPRLHGVTNQGELKRRCESCLAAVGLWSELQGELGESALRLSLEQMQRLCIARALALEPQILLMDEPCSSLDPVATQRIEGLMRKLSQQYTVLVVTHNMQQAARISDDTGFMLMGELIEMGPTASLFTHPRDKRTEDYVTGRYG